MPSAKNAFSLSSERLRNGRTAMLFSGVAAVFGTSFGFLAVIGFVCQPLHAGDRKRSGPFHEPKEIILATQRAHPVSVRHEAISAAVVRPLQAEYSVSERRRSAGRGERKKAAAARSEHEGLTLFHFNSKLGDVAVQPVISPAKGAQICISF